MKIHNIRFGFACNSSSTHSFIMFPGGHKLEDTGNVISDDSNNYEDHYGANPFVLASRQAKLGYIGVLLQEAVNRDKVPDYIWDYYVKDWLEGVAINRDGENDDMRGIRLPRCFGSDLPNKEFFEECKKLILDERVAILSSAEEEIIEAGESMPLLDKLTDESCEIARQDPVYGYWTLFDRSHGFKLRFSFNDVIEIKCASLPELVDLKITDYCQKQCGYCYQKSGRCGEHANYFVIEELIKALAKLQVFEIALGGGEPTTHPKFLDVLKKCKEYRIVPNFTTRNYDWFRDSKNVEVFDQCCGRVAFSAERPYDIAEVATIRDYFHFYSHRVCAQVIDKVSDIIELAKAAKKYGVDLTLLGFKETGRGEEYKFSKHQIERFAGFDAIREICGHRLDTRFYGAACGGISVDTKYLADHLGEIQKSGIEPRLYTTQEGVFSMYIDAVQRKMGPSSYCSAAEQVALDVDCANETSVPSLANQIQTFFQACSSKLAGMNLTDSTKRKA